MAMTAKAPTWESLRISSFRARLWWELRASATSRKPSRWMPPVTSSGSSAATAAKSRPPISSQPASFHHTSSAPPTTSPTQGKKQKA